ncbi:tetratricopeptide repeat-containing sensor histidine kinase [Fulvivirga lutimaris]|uniref:tetratricopeptide repeat-containing sensor histidine kinase n=1 Tax=Fulvivirga lutimaris TaxID=1819566 RepID=UPI0012BB7852|nr:tetratricopeptide repeat-containing sensor histidine kinase [Fulvivirga lutimaris]MTI40584.1 sensor histidine kinase [Fulvivirga lutimaris]
MKNKYYIVVIVLACLLSVGLTSNAQDTLQLNKLQKHYEQGSDSVKLSILLKIIRSPELDNIDTALSLSFKALDMATKMRDSLSMAIAMRSVGAYYNILSRNQEALKYDIEALDLIRKHGDGVQESRYLNNIGEDYYNLDLYNEAFDYYSQSLDAARDAGEELAEVIATYNMGRVLRTMGQNKKAKEYILDAMALSEEIGDLPGIAYAKHDLALIYMSENKFDEALSELDEAYVLSDSLSEDILTPQILVKTATAYDHKGDYRNALKNYDKALDLYKSQNNQSGVGESYYGKGNVTLHMGDVIGAKAYYQQCEKIADDIKDNELMISCYNALSELYEQDRNFESALQYYKKYKQLEDSIFSEKKKEQFAQIQIKYETARKDIEIELLNQKEEQQVAKLKNEEFIRNILVVILAFTAVLLFSLYKNNEKRRKINELLIEQQKEIKSKSKELSSLLEMKDKFFSIVSHDLRSPINALVGILDILHEGNLTQQELKDVSLSLKVRLDNTRKLLDTLLDWAMLQMNEIKIQKEDIELNKLVESNLAYFREVGDKKIDFINSVKGEQMVSADRNMLDLIIRNLVSNSIKFTDEGGKVEVTTEFGPKKSLIVLIKDNGIGMSTDQMDKLFDTNTLYTTRGTANEKGTGLGLRLCKEFVERMGGNIWVESVEGKGSTFKFTINRA